MLHTGGTSSSARNYYWSAAAYDSGHVFVVNEDGLLRARDAASGSLLWSAQMPGQWSFSSPPVASNGTVYLGGAGSGGTVYAVNESNGAMLWTASVMNGDDSSPALSDSGVYVSYACPQTYDFASATGAPLWHYSGPCEGGGGSTPVLTGGNLYVRDASSPSAGDVLNSATGTLVNTFTSGPPPAFAGNTGLFLSGGTLRAQDWTNSSNPTTLWSFAGDGGLDSAPLIVNNDVYIGSSTGGLYALDLASGQQVWSTSVGAGIPPSNDEQGGPGPTTGLGAGEGYLVAPAGSLLVTYRTASPPTVSATPISGTEGAAFSGTVASFTDSNPSSTGDAATIAWGDGTTSPGTVAPNGSGGYTVTGSHAYAEEGAYTVGVTVNDGSGSSTASSSASIGDAQLLSSGYALSGTTTGTAFTTRVLSSSDNDPGCAVSDYTATIAWGDGTTSTGSIAAGTATCSFSVSGTHTYATAGSYTITTTVRDAGGSTTSNSSNLSVKHHK